MKLIVGLGNPGRRYAGTPHNLGFDVVEVLARRWGMAMRLNERAQAEAAEGQLAGRAAMLVRPQTFMNLSGRALAPLVRQRELGEDDLLVVTDDVNLPIGRLRIRPMGGHGGHNGLRSIIECLGHDRFARLRVGIHPGRETGDLAAYVLSRPAPLEREQLGEMLDVAADAAELWAREGAPAAADRINGLRRFGAAAGDAD